MGYCKCAVSSHFYPRSPCGERRICLYSCADRRYFYPRSPCGERPCDLAIQYRQRGISIHALLAESDASVNIWVLAIIAFLSTLSLRRATMSRLLRSITRIISIHALLAESDLSMHWALKLKPYFYPRSPCGERPNQSLAQSSRFVFLSTLSLRRATIPFALKVRCKLYFYPRSPCGERPYLLGKFWDLVGISIHALLAESDKTAKADRKGKEISIHALLAESDLWAWTGGLNFNDFYPRSPCGERRKTDGSTTIPNFNFYPRSPCGERQLNSS